DLDGFPHDWPADIRMLPQIEQLVTERWREYGIELGTEIDHGLAREHSGSRQRRTRYATSDQRRHAGSAGAVLARAADAAVFRASSRLRLLPRAARRHSRPLRRYPGARRPGRG